MPELKIKVKGYKRISINADFEAHIVDGTLDDIFSGSLDGFNITNWRLNYFDPVITFKKNSTDMLTGESFTIDDINNGIVYLAYNHGMATVGSCNLTLSGDAKYTIGLTIYSTI